MARRKRSRRQRRKRNRAIGNAALIGVGGLATAGAIATVGQAFGSGAKTKKSSPIINSKNFPTKVFGGKKSNPNLNNSLTSTKQRAAPTKLDDSAKIRAWKRQRSARKKMANSDRVLNRANRLSNAVNPPRVIRETKGKNGEIKSVQISNPKLKTTSRGNRAILKEKIIAASGGRKNSRVTPEMTHQKVVLPRKKQTRSSARRDRIGSIESGFKSQSGKYMSQPQKKALSKLGWDPFEKKFEPGTSKRAKRIASKIFKSIGRFSRYRRLTNFLN